MHQISIMKIWLDKAILSVSTHMQVVQGCTEPIQAGRDICRRAGVMYVGHIGFYVTDIDVIAFDVQLHSFRE